MNKFILSILSSVIVSAGYGQSDYKKVIDPNYEELDVFVYGLAKAKKNDKWGLINEKGVVVVPFEYDYLGNFFKGLALVKKDGKLGFIDPSGKAVIDICWDTVDYPQNFSGEFCTMRKADSVIVYNAKAEVLLPLTKFKEFELDTDFALVQTTDGKYDVLSTKDWKSILEQPYDGVKKWSYWYKVNDKWTLLGRDFKPLFREMYDEVVSDYFPYCVKLNGKYGVIARNGNVIIPMVSDSAIYSTMINGIEYFPITQGKYIKLVDEDNKDFFTTEGEDVSDFKSNGLLVVKRNGKIGVVDVTNELFLPFEYDYVGDIPSYSSFAIIKQDGKEGLINAKAELTLKPVYDDITYIGDGEELYRIQQGEKFAIFSASDKKFITDFTFTDRSVLSDYSKQYAKTLRKDKTAENSDLMIAEVSEVNEESEYSSVTEAKELGENLYIVAKEYKTEIPLDSVAKKFLIGWEIKGEGMLKGYKYGLIDSLGKVILPAIYDEKFRSEEKYISTELNGTKVYLNDDLKPAITGYNSIGRFVFDYAHVTKNGKVGLVNIDGEEVLKPVFDDLGYCLGGYVSYKLGDKWGCIKLKKENKTFLAADIQFKIEQDFKDPAIQKLVITTLLSNNHSSTKKPSTQIMRGLLMRADGDLDELIDWAHVWTDFRDILHRGQTESGQDMLPRFK